MNQHKNWTVGALLLAACLSMTLTIPYLADEGMWLLNQPPTQRLEERFGFNPSDAWLEALQKSAVRLSDGGSASLVSDQGLVVTNYHVAFGQVAKLSSAENNLVENGFLARDFTAELPCPDLEAMVLWEIEDVTSRVKTATESKTSAADIAAAQRQVLSQIESESREKTGLHSQVVTLYGGGLYHLYRYKRYDDVRLVMSPEEGVGFFGGDVDNFEFPRFNLDVTFLRIYEDGKPLRNANYLRITDDGLKEGEPVLVAGHPGRTQRGRTVDHLRYMRDVAYPELLQRLMRTEVELEVFAEASEENRRVAERALLGTLNGRKAIGGKLRALQDPRLFGLKVAEEETLRKAVMAREDYQQQWGDAWDLVRQSLEIQREIQEPLNLLENRTFSGSRLFGLARGILRFAEERQKPNGERLREFSDGNLSSVELRLYSSAPIYDSLEINRLASGLALMAEKFGGEHPLVVEALASLSPTDRARQLVQETTIKDVETRRALATDLERVKASEDPLIVLARALDKPARKVRKRFEEDARGLERSGYDKLAAARFAVFGDRVYPDATFSLRLSLGNVAGYLQEGESLDAFTTLAGLYERSTAWEGEDPFDLPPRWLEKKDQLDLDTPFNLTSTNDIIGGNSGSPVVNLDREFVGIIFDGNRYSFLWDTLFSQERGRALSVDARAIVETLEVIYEAKELLAELNVK